MEVDGGAKPCMTSDHVERMKILERENMELKRANEILRKAAVFFAQAKSTAIRSNGVLNRRLLRPIRDLPPAEFEMMYHQQTEPSNVA